MFDMFINEHCGAQRGGNTMLNERQQDIVEFIKKEKRASVKKLAAQFFVSEMTIRRDLKELEIQKYLKRYNGGAIYYGSDLSLPVNVRKFLNAKEKNMLSRKAEKYLRNGLTVFIDSSSTCMYIIPLLAEYDNITIITNSVQNVLIASEHHISCIVAGGEYCECDMCTVGSETENYLRNINVDIAFFTTLGLSDDGVISDSDERQTAVRKAVMENSKKNLFLFESGKLHKKFPYTLCRTDMADDIIMI